jgi:HK97 family phage portal protein
MGLATTIGRWFGLAPVEQRAAAVPASPNFIPMFISDVLTGMWGEDKAKAIQTSVERSPLTIPTVYACVKRISEDIAKTPVQVVRRTGPNMYEPIAERHPLERLLNESPDGQISAFDFRAAMIQHSLLWGNGRCVGSFGPDGAVARLSLMLPERTAVLLDDRDRIVYEYQSGTQVRRLSSAFVADVRNMGHDGIIGYSTVRLARESLAVAAAGQRFGSEFFSDGARMSGILHYKGAGAQNDKQREALVQSWQAQRGPFKYLNSDVGYIPVGMPLQDAQFLETMQHTVRDICRWFGVPPHKVGDEDGSKASIDQREIAYVKDALSPIMRKIEVEFSRKFLPTGLELVHDEDELMRGDPLLRAQTQAMRRQWGTMTINEVRAQDGMPPVTGGDVPFVPANMMTLENALRSTDTASPGMDGAAANVQANNTGDPNESGGLPNNIVRSDATRALEPILARAMETAGRMVADRVLSKPPERRAAAMVEVEDRCRAVVLPVSEAAAIVTGCPIGPLAGVVVSAIRANPPTDAVPASVTAWARNSARAIVGEWISMLETEQ